MRRNQCSCQEMQELRRPARRRSLAPALSRFACAMVVLRDHWIGKSLPAAKTIAVIVAARPAIAVAQPPVPAADAAAAAGVAAAFDPGFGAGIGGEKRTRLQALDRMADRVFTLSLMVGAGRDVDFGGTAGAIGAGVLAGPAAHGQHQGGLGFGPAERGASRPSEGGAG